MEIREPWQVKLSVLDKRIRAFTEGYRQNVAILGHDQEEANYLINSYFKDNRLSALYYVRVATAYGSGVDFFRSLALSILSEYTHSRETLDFFLRSQEALLPKTTQFIKLVLKKDAVSLLDTLGLIDKFISETEKKCVFIIEEFLGLESIFPDSLRDFAKFIILQRNCMVVMSSCSPTLAEKILSQELNLLFGNFEKLFLSDTVFLNHYLYIKDKLQLYSLSPFFLSFFVNILGANVIYYDVISQAIKDGYDKDNEQDSIVSILERSLYCQQTYFFQKFLKRINLITREFKDYRTVIKLIVFLAEGYLRLSDLAPLGLYDSKTLKARLVKLRELNYIVEYGNIYKIQDSLFSFWLARVFKAYFFSTPSDVYIRDSSWRKEIKHEITLFKDDFFKEKIKKIAELLSNFKDDIVYTGKNRYTLPAIEKTKIISYPEKNLHLLIAEGREIIFAGIKEAVVEDSDIFEFIEQSSSVKGRKVKKIFMSVEQFTPQAKLIAKNNKLMIWDRNDINRLLHMYNMPVMSLASGDSRRLEHESTSSF